MSLFFYRDVELGATKEDGTVVHMLSKYFWTI